MGRRHDQLTLQERHALFRLHAAGTAVGAIADRLGRHRNRRADGAYLPETAQRFAWARRLRGSKLERHSQLGELVRDRLAMGWSPEQIAGRLRRAAAQHRISHESIYAGSTVRSAGASAFIATWRGPSRATHRLSTSWRTCPMLPDNIRGYPALWDTVVPREGEPPIVLAPYCLVPPVAGFLTTSHDERPNARYWRRAVTSRAGSRCGRTTPG